MPSYLSDIFIYLKLYSFTYEHEKDKNCFSSNRQILTKKSIIRGGFTISESRIFWLNVLYTIMTHFRNILKYAVFKLFFLPTFFCVFQNGFGLSKVFIQPLNLIGHSTTLLFCGNLLKQSFQFLIQFDQLRGSLATIAV